MDTKADDAVSQPQEMPHDDSRSCTSIDNFQDIFLERCESLDPFDESFDDNVEQIVANFDQTKSASIRLMDLMGDAMRSCLNKNKDLVLDLDRSAQDLRHQVEDLTKANQDKDKRILELESETEIFSGAKLSIEIKDKRIQELEAELEISEGERSLLDKKLALAMRKGGRPEPEQPVLPSPTMEFSPLVAQNQQMQFAYSQVSMEVHRLSQENMGLQHTAQTYAVQNHELKKEISTLRHELDIARRRRPNSRPDSAALDRSTQEAEALRKQLADMKVDLDFTSRANRELESSLATVSDAQKTVEAELAKSQTMHAELTAQFGINQAAHTLLESELAKHQQEASSLAAELAKYQQENSSLAAELAKTRAEQKASTPPSAKSKVSGAGTEKELLMATTELAEAKKARKDLEDKLAESKAAHKQSEDKLAESKAAHKQSEAKLATVAQCLEFSSAEFATLQKASAAKDETIKGLAEEVAALKSAKPDDTLRATKADEELQAAKAELSAVLRDIEADRTVLTERIQEQARKEKERAVAEVRRQWEEEVAGMQRGKAWARAVELKTELERMTEQAELHKKKRDEAAAEAKAARLQQRLQEDELFKCTKALSDQEEKIAYLEANARIRAAADAEAGEGAQRQSKPKQEDPCRAKATSDLQKAVDTLKGEKASLHAKVGKLEATEAAHKMKLKDLRDEIDMLRSQLQNSEKARKDAPAKLAAFSKEVEELKKTVAEIDSIKKESEALKQENTKMSNALLTRSDLDDKDALIEKLNKEMTTLRIALKASETCVEACELKECIYIAQVFGASICLLSAFRGQQVMPALVFAALDKQFPDHFGVIKHKLRSSKEKQQKFVDYVFGPCAGGSQGLSTYHRVMKILDLIQSKGNVKWGNGPSEIMVEQLSLNTKLIVDLLIKEKMPRFPSLETLHEAQENAKMQVFYFIMKAKDKAYVQGTERLKGLIDSCKKAADHVHKFEEAAAPFKEETEALGDLLNEVDGRLMEFSHDEFQEVDEALDANYQEGFKMLSERLIAKGKKRTGGFSHFDDLIKRELCTTFAGKPIPHKEGASPSIDAQPALRVVMFDPADASSILQSIEDRAARFAEPLEASVSPAEDVDASPSPAEDVEASPSPAEDVDASPSPAVEVEASPSPAVEVEVSLAPSVAILPPGEPTEQEDDDEKPLLKQDALRKARRKPAFRLSSKALSLPGTDKWGHLSGEGPAAKSDKKTKVESLHDFIKSKVT